MRDTQKKYAPPPRIAMSAQPFSLQKALPAIFVGPTPVGVHSSVNKWCSGVVRRVSEASHTHCESQCDAAITLSASDTDGPYWITVSYTTE